MCLDIFFLILYSNAMCLDYWWERIYNVINKKYIKNANVMNNDFILDLNFKSTYI